MNAKHTPGPWVPMIDRDDCIRGLRGWHGPESVNVINWNGISRASSEIGQANARLIAAAPELLEFAIYARAFFAELYGDDAVAARLASEAIAKATGEPE